MIHVLHIVQCTKFSKFCKICETLSPRQWQSHGSKFDRWPLSVTLTVSLHQLLTLTLYLTKYASYWFFQSLSLFFFLLLSLDSFILSFSISHGSQERVNDSKEVLWLVLWGILSKELTHGIKLLGNKGRAKILSITSTNNRQTVVCHSNRNPLCFKYCYMYYDVHYHDYYQSD